MRRPISVSVILVALVITAAAVNFIFPDSTAVLDSNVLAASESNFVVTSTADSGPGTLREAIGTVASGETITFDPSVFPPINPAIISLTNYPLPELNQGSVTIDASDAGVIVDGTNIGEWPIENLLDDVSLTIDGGANALVNGDFGAGLGHWGNFDERPGHIRGLNTNEYVSAPQSLSVQSTAQMYDARTYYDTFDQHVAYPSNPLEDPESPIWIPATPGQQVELAFWFKTVANVSASIIVQYSSGWSNSIVWYDSECCLNTWTLASLSATVRADGVAVALQINTHHDHRWDQGLYITSDNNTIRGLELVNFPGVGIDLRYGASNNFIGGDRTVGVGPHGQGNLISGNGSNGIAVWDSGTSGNIIQGNWIGLDSDGTGAWGNLGDGIIILNDASGNLIGGAEAGKRNVISGNGSHGIGIYGSATSGNNIRNNYIGTDASGTAAVPNLDMGIELGDGTHDNTIGGANPAFRNIVTYGMWEGINLWGPNTSNNTISGNWIGVDADGTRDVKITQIAYSPAYISDDTIFVGSYVPGSDGQGLFKTIDGGSHWIPVNDGLTDLRVTALVLSPDYASDQTLFASTEDGVFRSVDGGITWVDVSPESFDREIHSLAISPNYTNDETLLLGNSLHWQDGEYYGGVLKSTDGGASWVDLGLSGDAPPLQDVARLLMKDGNRIEGQDLRKYARITSSDIGYLTLPDGSTTGTDSFLTVLGTNWRPGLSVAFSPGYENDQTIFVGTHEGSLFKSLDGGASWSEMSNGLEGTSIYWIQTSPDYASDQTLFAGYNSDWSGVPYRSTNGGADWMPIINGLPEGTPSMANFAVAGFAVSPNFANDGTLYTAISDPWASFGEVRGVYMSSDRGNNWARTEPGVKDQHWLGPLAISPGFTSDQEILQAVGRNGLLRSTDAGQNWAYANGDLTDPGNTDSGITIWEASDNTIGGATAAEGNIISNNGYNGILIDNASGNLISHNFIGTDPTGLTGLGNDNKGVEINPGATGNIVAWNVTSSNTDAGLGIWGDGTTNNTFEHNFSGTDAMGEATLANKFGVNITGGSNNFFVNNVLSGNWGGEVAIWGNETINNVLQGNLVGMSADGSKSLSQFYGIGVGGGHGTLIGGDQPGEGNTVAHTFLGIHTAGASSTRIVGNTIYRSTTGIDLLGDSDDTQIIGNHVSRGWIGIEIEGTSYGSTIEGNEIHDNVGTGIRVVDSAAIQNTISRNSIYNNGGLGINLVRGGNTELPEPVISAFNLAAGTVNGEACAFCTIEIYSDENGEGRTFEITATAGAGGDWTASKGFAFVGPELTATATDVAGNTSEFGQDWPAEPPPAPVITAPVCGVTNDPEPLFSGIAQVASTVHLGSSGLNLGSGTAGDQNTWFVPSFSSLSDGDHVITATATTQWGTSPASTLDLSVDATLCFDPVGITFEQGNALQHMHDVDGCADPANNLEVILRPVEPVTVSVPISPSNPITLTVNNIDYPMTDGDGDGIYTATFTPPSGQVVIVLQLDCGTIQIGSVIDPDGYVYDADEGIDARIAEAHVTLYFFDTVRDRWIKWPASVYGQTNPQRTGEDGYYSFFVPPGDYQVRVKKFGFEPYISPTLTVTDVLVRHNIPLNSVSNVVLPIILRPTS